MVDQNGSGAMGSRNLLTSFTSHQVDPRLRAKVITFALYSRLSVIILAFLFDLIVPNHDAGSFTWTPSSDGSMASPTVADRFVSLMCDGLTLR